MNTNNNVYTVIYTTVVCVLVAAILAFASQSLKPRQQANEKAETISQILSAAQFFTKEECSKMGNSKVIDFYKENIASSKLIDLSGAEVGSLDMASAEVYSVSDLKKQNYNIKDAAAAQLPVYIFKNGVSVIPIYGAGLWGPIWGYVAFQQDLTTIAGAYFDHDSETPGLGGKIKDDPSFRAQFSGKKVLFGEGKAFNIVKGGAPEGMENGIDAITGATMTSKGVDAALNQWFEAYKSYLGAQEAAAVEEETPCEEEASCEEEVLGESETINEEE